MALFCASTLNESLTWKCLMHSHNYHDWPQPLLSLDPQQLSCRANRSTESTVATDLHSTLPHLEQQGSYTQILAQCSTQSYQIDWKTVPLRLPQAQGLQDNKIRPPYLPNHQPQGWVPPLLTLRNIYTQNSTFTHPSSSTYDKLCLWYHRFISGEKTGDIRRQPTHTQSQLPLFDYSAMRWPW